MSASALISTRAEVIYPEDDGLPMSDNTRQYEYMVTIKGGLDALFHHDPNVFIAGNLLWYPVEGNNKICLAADVMAAFGRPKSHRGSYRQWEENGVAPQVAFEILSPSNRPSEMERKFQFYERYKVEEYYIYDPDTGDLSGFLRQGDRLIEIPVMEGWLSPRLGVRFHLNGNDLELYANGHKLPTYVELDQVMQQQRAEKEQALQEIKQLGKRADQEKQRADQEKQRADQEKQHADEEKQRADKLLAQLKALGVDPDA
jgi:Uma2 family endonuclease